MLEFDELIYREPYCSSFDAKVVSCEKKGTHWETILSDTAFYPEGGGQNADHGTINGIVVEDVQKVDGKIIHYMNGSVEKDSMVHGAIDWDRRFDAMQNHTGEHILSGLVHQKYGYDNVGFHMGDKIQVDFNGPLTWEQLKELEDEANRIITKDVLLKIWFPDVDAKIKYRSKKELADRIRIVEIPGADVCACCGTHVTRTGEVGMIKILSVMKNRTGVRIELLCGNRCMDYMQKIYDQNRKISGLLSANGLNTASAVEHLLQDNNELHAKYRKLCEDSAIQKASHLPENQKVLFIAEKEMDRITAIKLSTYLVEEKHAGIGVVLVDSGKGIQYYIVSHSIDLRTHVKEWNAKLNGRGGGKADMIQGFFQAINEEIEEVIQQSI